MKAKVKRALDVLLTLGLLFQMGYQFYAEAAHEWAGAGMFALFIAHHALNAGWYKAVFRGRYTPYRVFQLAVNTLLLAAMLFLMVSGIMLSNHVFGFLGIGFGASFARLAHLAASHWGFVLMALHLGLHWGMITARLKLRSPGVERARRARRLLRAVRVYRQEPFGLHVPARGVCISGLLRAHSALLYRLPCDDGAFHLRVPPRFQAAAKARRQAQAKGGLNHEEKTVHPARLCHAARHILRLRRYGRARTVRNARERCFRARHDAGDCCERRAGELGHGPDRLHDHGHKPRRPCRRV